MKNQTLTVSQIGILLWLAVSSAGQAETPPAAANVQSYIVDLAEQRQVIDHFGASDAWSFHKIGAWSESAKNRIADLLYTTDKGIGLTFCRFNVGAGVNHQTIEDDWRTSETFETSQGKYDWNRLTNERWFMRAAKARGITKFGLTVYSPPARMTRNGLTNLGSDNTSTTNLKTGMEQQFAAYLTDVLVHFRDNPDPNERIDFDCVFPINEPQWDWHANQEGNRASNEDIRRIHLALQDRLRRAGLRTRIAGPESGSIPDMTQIDGQASSKWHADYGDYLHFLTGDPELARGLGGVMTYHSYWSDRFPDQLVPNRDQLGKALMARPGWKLWQSEYCIMERGRDLKIDSALRAARVIHCDMAYANASSWQWWLAVSNENYKSGLIYTNYHKPGDTEDILESKILWALGNYSRFIRPGMRRVEMRGGLQDVNGLMASAYLDQSNGHVVVVFVNMAKNPVQVRIALARGEKVASAPLQAVPYTTSETSNLDPGTAVDAFKGLEIPAGSIVTLVCGS